MRLNRYLAMCGVASRRSAETVIREGRVAIGGEIVLDPARDVAPSDLVTADGKEIRPEPFVYVVMNKPMGYVSASSDPFYPTVLDLLPKEDRRFRLYPAGRLDRESQGLLILTNDGGFCNRLIHPSSGYTKTYEVLVDKAANEDLLKRWRQGVPLSDKEVRPVSLEVMDKAPKGRWLSVELSEGLKREIRLMASFFSLSVLALFRRKIGRMELRKLKTGEYRFMKLQEMWRAIRRGGNV